MKFKLRNLKHWTSQNWLLFRHVVSLMDFSHHTHIFRFLKINYQRYRTKFFGRRTPQNRNKITNSAGNIFGTSSFSKLLHTPFKNYLELFPKKPLLGSSTTMFRYLLWHLIWAQVLHDELVLQIHTERYLGSQVHFGICRPKVSESDILIIFDRHYFFLIGIHPHTMLNSYYAAWSYKKKSTKKITGHRKSV